MKNTSSLPHLPGVQDKYKWAEKSLKQLQRNFLLPCSQNCMIATHYPIIDLLLNWKLFQLYGVTNLTNIAIMQFWWMYCGIHSLHVCFTPLSKCRVQKAKEANTLTILCTKEPLLSTYHVWWDTHHPDTHPDNRPWWSPDGIWFKSHSNTEIPPLFWSSYQVLPMLPIQRYFLSP